MALFRMTTLVFGLSLTAAHAQEVGFSTFNIDSTESGRNLQIAIWYPALPDGKSVNVGDNSVFTGTPSSLNATPTKGRFPLVLLSHGSGGNVQAAGWLATKLVKAGFVVAGPNHPGTTSGDSTPESTSKIWQRTGDISALIDYLDSNKQWAKSVDKERIGIVGFSLGGATAMELAGAQANLEAFARFCDDHNQWGCAWLAGGVGYKNGERIKVEKVDLRAVDKDRFEQSNLDSRIKSAVLIDPGFAVAFDEKSLRSIAIPMSFINLGDAGKIPPAVIADRLATLTPHGTYATVAGADHFSFLPVCKDGASAFLKSVGEFDPICDEAKRPRAEIQQDIATLVQQALANTLQSRK